MLKALCYGSGSSGNCYILTFFDGKSYTQSIMVECGIPIKEILRKNVENQVKTADLKCCLVTHGHGDHDRAYQDIRDRYIPIFASKETLEDNRDYSPARELISGEIKVVAPDLIVLPFEACHDFPGSMGFIIFNRVTGDKVLFINDCKYVEYDLSEFTFDYVFIECNYFNDQVRAIYNEALKRQRSGEGTRDDLKIIREYQRVLDTHMGLYTTIRTLKKAKVEPPACKTIMLMHLSERHANEYEMKQRISSMFGIPTFVCGRNGGIK